LRERALREAEDRARDHEALDLARALVDLRDLRVAVIALDRELFRVAVAAEDLDRLGGLPARRLRGEELRLRALLAVRQALLAAPGGPVDEQACRVDLCRHVRELPLDRLEVGDPPAELTALERVPAGDVERGDAARAGRVGVRPRERENRRGVAAVRDPLLRP